MHLARTRRTSFKKIKSLAPCRLLAGMDIPKMKHMPLHHFASFIHMAVLHQTPIVVFLAVFETLALFEKPIGPPL